MFYIFSEHNPIASAFGILIILFCLNDAMAAGGVHPDAQQFSPIHRQEFLERNFVYGELAGDWTEYGGDEKPELRIMANQTKTAFIFFKMHNGQWTKFAELKPSEFNSVWLFKAQDGSFQFGTPAADLNLKRIE